MSFLRSRFVQAVLVLVIAFVVLRFGIRPPAPWSVLTLYMSIVLLAVLVDRKSTRLNSSHLVISYAVFCLKKKKKQYLPVIASASVSQSTQHCHLSCLRD